MLFHLSVGLCSHDLLLLYDIIDLIANLKSETQSIKGKVKVTMLVEMCATENALTKVS
jgi:hypothetical protein